MSDLGESPTLRDAILRGIAAFNIENATHANLSISAEGAHIEASVRKWLAAVVPSPQPADEEDVRFAIRLALLFDECAKEWTVGDVRRVADVCVHAAMDAHDIRLRFDPDYRESQEAAAVSPLPETEQTPDE